MCWKKKQEAERLILSRSPFIDSFIQQIVMDSLLCAKHYSWPQKYNSEEIGTDPPHLERGNK